MKKKEDARLAILREYDRWAKDHPNDAKKMGGYVFFTYLEKEKPDLLEFRAAGSKWKSFTSGFVTEVDWKIKGGQVVLGVMVEMTQVYRDLTGF